VSTEAERQLQSILETAAQYRASDILLKVGQPPALRVGKVLRYLQGAKLSDAYTRAFAEVVLTQSRFRGELDDCFQFDSAYSLAGVGRYRVNVYRQRGSFALAFRAIPNKVPTLAQLGGPSALQSFAEMERGLVLVVGATGHGKSTTLAAMIGHMNHTRRIHIVTIEDPIEFLHQDGLASVSQREIGVDTDSFAAALRAALRQNPDTILVGEIRDGETMEIGLQAAETGHLVLSTMHTPDVARTLGRVLSLSNHADPQETRERFADNLRGIVAQRLVPRTDGAGLALVCEIMVVTGTARDSIRRPENALPLKDVMERGTHPYGMQTFRMHLESLVSQGIITSDTAQRTLN